MSIEKAKYLIDSNQIQEAKSILYSMENDNVAEVYFLLARCHQSSNLYETTRYLDKAIELDANHLNAIVLLHDMFGYQMISEDRVKELRNRIIHLTPGNKAFVYRSMGIDCLRNGDYVNGFALYEHRLDIPDIKNDSIPKFPRWDGKESLQGKKILIRAEEGFGDNIQFFRLAKTLKDRYGAIVSYYGETGLVRLFEKTGIFHQVLNRTEDHPIEYDYEVMMYSLPYLLNITLDNIPTDQYLIVKEEDRRWQKPLSIVKEMRVGLVWSGDKRNNKNRAVHFEQFRPLFDANCHFFSLQKGDAQKQILECPPHKPFHDVMDYMKDFYDTACLIQELDLVITVDTAMAHLAASLHKPVWLLHRYNGCWRWLNDRTDSPWYPTMKIYRQETPENWNKTINMLAKDLIDFSK